MLVWHIEPVEERREEEDKVEHLEKGIKGQEKE